MLNEKIYPHFISDSPKGIDCFEEHTQEQLAANICKYIKSIDSEPDKKLGGNIPRIIGIEGGWGSGKSNVVSMIDRDLCKTHHPLNFHPYTLRRMNIFDQKMPLEVTF